MTAPKTHTAIVAIRTAIQIIASGGFLAIVGGILAATGRYLPAGWWGVATATVTGLVMVAHNALEDQGLIGTFLRQPTLSPAGVQRVSDRAAQKAADEVDRAATQAAKVVPLAAPLISQWQDVLDQAVAAMNARVDQLAAQLPPASNLTIRYGGMKLPANVGGPIATISGPPGVTVDPTVAGPIQPPPTAP